MTHDRNPNPMLRWLKLDEIKPSLNHSCFLEMYLPITPLILITTWQNMAEKLFFFLLKDDWHCTSCSFDF